MKHGRTSAFVALAGALLAFPVAADDLSWEAPKRHPRIAIRDVHTQTHKPLLSRNGVEIHPLSPEDLLIARAAMEALHGAGDGGGGDVVNLVAIQSRYLNDACGPGRGCLSPCNAVLLLWTETTYNPWVTISIEGQPIRILGGLPEDHLPGENGITIARLNAGEWLFSVTDPTSGSSSECLLNVLNTPPLSDPQNLVCTEGGADPGGDCTYTIEWDLVGINLEAVYTVLIDGDVAATVAAPNLGTVLRSVPAGPHTVQVIGFLPVAGNPCAGYRSCLVEATCPKSCNPDYCPPPARLRVCQSDYGTMGALRVDWLNPVETYEAGIHGFFDGELVSSFDGNTQMGFISGVPLGDHTISVRGDCDPARGLSNVAEVPFAVIAQAPFIDPVRGDVLWSFDAEAGTTTVAWNASRPFAFADIYLRVPGTRPGDPPTEILAGTVGYRASGVTLAGTDGTEMPFVQFFDLFNRQCYGSEKAASLPFSPCLHCSAGEITPGGTVQADFPASGCPVGGFLGPAVDLYRFRHPKSGRVTVRAESKAFTPILRILDAACREVVAQPSPGLEFAVVLPPGEFAIEVSAAEGAGAGGPYTLEASVTGDYFIRGACGDPRAARPHISGAVFLLGHLFLGGPAPPCKAACDVNGDGRMELTDAVHLLLFLFQSGPPPAGWAGAASECTFLSEEMDCAVPSEACPLNP